MRTVLTALVLSLALSTGAPAWAGPAPELQAMHLDASGFDRLEAVALDASFADSQLQALRQSADWRVRMNAGVVAALRADPGAARAVMQEAPEPTRAGLPRFVGQHYRSADAAPVLMHRFFSETDVGTRYAIAEMLPRTGGDWGEAVEASWQQEQNAFVRSVLVESIRHAEDEHAFAVLPLAAADSDAQVRAAAMRSIGWHDDGARFSDALVAGLSDSDSEVRAFAARALGWKGVDSSWDSLRGALSDADADVRLRALRALQRMDPARAAELGELQALQSDVDSKVARAAAQIAGG